MDLIQAKSLAFRTLDGSRALQHGLNFTLPHGELLWIQGENGTGKTTLLEVLQGRHPHAGTLVRHSPNNAVVPQLESSSLHLPLTLGDYVRLSVPQFAPQRDWPTDWFGPRIQQTPWNRASGGERRRALVVRALASQPSLLFLDEPMNHLDVESRRLILQILAAFLSSDSPAGIVLVSHDDVSREMAQLGIRHRTLRLEAHA